MLLVLNQQTYKELFVGANLVFALVRPSPISGRTQGSIVSHKDSVGAGTGACPKGAVTGRVWSVATRAGTGACPYSTFQF